MGVHYSRVIENQLDVSHFSFVPRTTIGRGNKCLANGSKVVWLGSRANKIIERQDKRIVIAQLPKVSALGMNETLVVVDMPIIEYKQKREAFRNRLSCK